MAHATGVRFIFKRGVSVDESAVRFETKGQRDHDPFERHVTS